MSDPDGLDAQQPAGESTAPQEATEPASAAADGDAADTIVAASAEPGTSGESVPGSDADLAAAHEALGEPLPDAGGDAPRRPRHPFYLRGRRPHLPRSRRGLLALVLILVGMGGVFAVSGVGLIQWTETADFCGRCHTMAPELKAYEQGPHRDVACAECHVAPGVGGWIKAKIAGTRQLVEVVLGTYPTPIPAPNHNELPGAADTCQKCHALDDRQFVKVNTRTAYSPDEQNTRQNLGLMIRPTNGNAFDVNQSVHWHVTNDVEFTSAEVNAPVIDYVKSIRKDGTTAEFISQRKVTDADNVQPDIDAVLAAEETIKMSCYDCHNRVGHNVTNPRLALDYQLYTGEIDNTLPYIKREGLRILWNGYPDQETAFADADKLADFYKENYPDVYATKLAQINQAIGQIKALYPLTATPQMDVTSRTYANEIGHTDFPGCFRCHDGGHYKVVDGKATKEVIPSTCDTCHTFPQIGPAVASLPLGEPPSTHHDKMWVFNHKDVATDIDPAKQTCAECHARDYCVNCHSTGAITVNHDEMATNHAAVIRESGNKSCAYCHQPVFCARCHTKPVLPTDTPYSIPTTSGAEPSNQPSGVSWPLQPLGLAPGATGATGARSGASSPGG